MEMPTWQEWVDWDGEMLNQESPRCAISPELVAHWQGKMCVLGATLGRKMPFLVGYTFNRPSYEITFFLCTKHH